MSKSKTSSLLNKSFAKKFILKQFEARRAGPPMTRVSSEYLQNLESRIRTIIQHDVDSHRSVGKTFNP